MMNSTLLWKMSLIMSTRSAQTEKNCLCHLMRVWRSLFPYPTQQKVKLTYA